MFNSKFISHRNLIRIGLAALLLLPTFSAAQQRVYLLGGPRPSWVPVGAIAFDDFVNNRSWPSGTPASRYTNVNSTGKFVEDLAGGFYSLRQVAANTLPLGLGVGINPEPAVTILNLHAQDRNNAYWNNNRVTASDNQTAAPDSTTTAASITEDGTTNSHVSLRNPVTISASTAYTLNLFIQRKDFDWSQLAAGDGATFFWGNFNANTEVAGLAQAATTVRVKSSYIHNFMRGSISFTSGGAATSTQINYYLSRLTGNNNGVAPSYQGDSASGIYIWGTNFIASSFPASYWPTTTTSTPRSSDVVTRTTGPDVGAVSGQITITAHTALGINAANQVLWQQDDGTQNERRTVYRDTSRFIHFVDVTGGVIQSDRTIWAVPDDTDLTIIYAWSGSACQYTLNGMIAPFIEYNCTQPVGITTDREGADASGNQWAGVIKTRAFAAAPALPGYVVADSFNRANTAPGTLGTPPVGNTWVEYSSGSDPLPPATNGYISSKAYIADQNAVAYAYQAIGHVPTNVLQQLSLTTLGGATGGSSPAILISNLAAGNIATCVHLPTNRSSMSIQKRISGVFTTLATVSYPTLKTDGSLYQILSTTSTTSIANDTVTRHIVGPGLDQTITATDPDLATITGPNFYSENLNTDAVDQARIQFVGAF